MIFIDVLPLLRHTLTKNIKARENIKYVFPQLTTHPFCLTSFLFLLWFLPFFLPFLMKKKVSPYRGEGRRGGLEPICHSMLTREGEIFFRSFYIVFTLFLLPIGVPQRAEREEKGESFTCHMSPQNSANSHFMYTPTPKCYIYTCKYCNVHRLMWRTSWNCLPI